MVKNDTELLAQGELTLRQAKEFSQSLSGASVDVVETPQVRLERGRDWSLNGAVVFHLG